MSGNGNQVPLAPNQRGPGPYPRAPTPHRNECYHQPGGAGAAYMQAGAPAQAAQPMRVPPAQPTAPPQQQQERPSASMPTHSYCPPQNQTSQNRPQYSNYPFRTPHGTRPSSHPRQQQPPYIPNAAASSTTPVMYPIPFAPAHMVPPTYQQQRSQGYYPYMTPYIYNTGTLSSHTPSFYFTSSTPQMPAANLTASGPGARGASSLVGPQGGPAAPAATTAMQHPSQPPTHLHQNMSGLHTNTGKRISHRVPIINPVTKQDIFQEINSNDNQYMSGESSERQTPQPEAFSVAEEFSRKVNEVANQPTLSESMMKTTFTPKNAEVPMAASPPAGAIPPPGNAVNSVNIVTKPDSVPVNDTKSLGADVTPETSETPVVSAITDSPVIVPKIIPIIKQMQKSSEQSSSVDTNKNITSNKHPKQSKNKPVVPQTDEEKVESVLTQPALVPASVTSAVPTPVHVPVPASAPADIPKPTPTAAPSQTAIVTQTAIITQVATPTQAATLTQTATLTQAATPIQVEAPTQAVVSTQAPMPTQAATSTQAASPTQVAAPTQIALPTPASISDSISAAAPTPALVPVPTPTSTANIVLQPLRVSELGTLKSEEKDKQMAKETEQFVGSKPNGPTVTVGVISIDNPQENVNPSTSQTFMQEPIVDKVVVASINSEQNEEELKQSSTIEQPVIESSSVANSLSATELLSDSIEAVTVKTKKDSLEEQEPETTTTELPVASQAQARLNLSLASCNRNYNLPNKMKDINLNNKNSDPDTANGNTTETSNLKKDKSQEDVNKNNNKQTQKTSKTLDKKTQNKMANCEPTPKDNDSYENGKNETDNNVSNIDPENEKLSDKEANEKQMPTEKPVFTPKYKYTDDQWSPLNTSGRRCYDLGLLKQIKDDPLSKFKPESTQILEQLKVMRDTSLPFSSILRPINDSVLPTFLKNPVGNRNPMRDPKKDGRMTAPSGKGSVKLLAGPNMSSGHKPVIHLSLSLREDVKLNETENAWKPSRFKKGTADEELQKTEEIKKKFRGILNKLTPQKFDTLLNRVKGLEIDTQPRLEDVIDLIFEKAIDEPNFSEAYAAMCNKLSVLKVPAEHPATPDQVVNFRNLIISRCQNQFVTNKVDEQVSKIENDLAECTDPARKKELQALLEEENRKVRMRSVGNVRFIGELYKLKMLTAKIMLYCMNYLIDKVDEEKLECLCKLLTTIGEQVEGEVKEPLDGIFKRMQELVDKKSSKISSRVRFMIQDVIELRKRKWYTKSVMDSQPKMMDQIQKEAEQQQRQIELMNASSMGSGSFRRDDGGRGKRGDGRRQGPMTLMDNNWQSPRTKYSVDTSKLKVATNKNLQNIKLAPHQSPWNQGSGAKTTTQQASNSLISLPTTTNMYSVLENVQTDPSTLRSNKDQSPGYHSKGASIERSTFNSRPEYGTGSSRTGSMTVPRSNSGNRNTASPRDSRSGSPAPPVRAPTPPAPAIVAPIATPTAVEQEPMPENRIKTVKSIIDQWLVNNDDNEMVDEVKHRFTPHHHAALVTELLNVAVEKPTKDAIQIARAVLHLVSNNIISPDNFVRGLNDVFEFAPDLHIDIPMLYENLGIIMAPQVEKKHITFSALLKLSDVIIAANHGHLFLRSLLREMKTSMGPSFVANKWQESGIEFSQWMNEDQVAKFIEDNKLEFLEGSTKASEKTNKILTPGETQSKLLQLMNSEETRDCICGWVRDNLGKASNEDWFMRSLIQAICEYALFGPDSRNAPHFKKDRMSKYTTLINDFGETKKTRESNCLVGIQQLVHRLEHPQGLTLELFQYLHEQYIISVEGFLLWEASETEPEGKGVMMKALTSFFTSIKEADNEDSCSED